MENEVKNHNLEASSNESIFFSGDEAPLPPLFKNC